MQLRRPDRSAASPAAPTASIWRKLDASAPQSSHPTTANVSSSPAARSGHAMTLLPPTNSVLLFGGADGRIFFEDVFLLEPTSYDDRSRRVATRSSRREDEEATTDHVQWKKLLVSACTAQSPHSPMFSSARSNSESPRAVGSGVERRTPTFLHPGGGGRDYHTMHYVQSSEKEEKARGMRVLVVGNVVVCSNEAARGGGTQTEGGTANPTMVFDAPTLRVEELRVRQPLLEAQWETRRVDHASMWKPRARHAHSSVVVGGEQLFVFGGKDAASSTFFNDIFYYDAPLNQWVKPIGKPTGQLPQPRAFAGLTASDDGNTLFLFGGTDGKQEFGSLFLYDVMHSRWDSLAGATLGERPSCRINHSLAFVAPNHLVLFGGRRRAVRQNELFIYNVSTRAWRLAQGGPADGTRSTHRRGDQTSGNDNAPIGRTAHATVCFRTEPAGLNAVQKMLVFGGYAGSHTWLDDLYLLSLPQAVLMQPPSTCKRSSRSIAATQRTQPARAAFNTVDTAARVALSAPQQPIQTYQFSQSAGQQEKSTLSVRPSQQSAHPVQEPPQISQTTQPVQQQEQTAQSVEPEKEPSEEQPRQLSQSSTAIGASYSQQQSFLQDPSRSDPVTRATTGSSSGSGVLTDITNQGDSSSQKQQQESAIPLTSGLVNTRTDTASTNVIKKHKRRRLVEGSQDSNNSNSNSTNGSGELTTLQVGIQTTLVQLLQKQPRVEDLLARILSMLTREQTARQHQSMNQETMMRVHSDEQSKLLEAATRRNEALEGRLARSEAERASLHEKLMARETELYMHKHSLEVAIPPLNERVRAIEDSHMQQLNVSRVIESKISAVHDFMDELRNAGGEGTEADDSPQQQRARIPYKDRYGSYICAGYQNCKEVLTLKEMTDKVRRVEERETQARQFLFSWCQGGAPTTTLVPAMPANTTATVSTLTKLTKSESAGTGSDNMTTKVDS
ncbi:Cell polarity protein (Tea1) [Phytophthora megakarya]|uniref:Cell polarity protein (Tea1) n=1 Tax=Phytophthora megakarya TaxID=4795 RepID=A0A225WZ76_9STRA|nr:Cell polarity protein (Tea1) [Phytophthora megakarya]